MFGVRYYKAGPTTFVLQHVNGRVRREGAGLSFFGIAVCVGMFTACAKLSPKSGFSALR